MSTELQDILTLASKVKQELEKEAFTPVAPGLSPGETEQALMQEAQMQEAQMQGMPPGAPPPDGMPPGAPPGAPPGDEDPVAVLYDVVVQAVRQVFQEMGVPGGEEGKKKQPANKDRLETLEAKFDEMMVLLQGGGMPPAEEPPPAGFGPGAGEAAPPPMGPLDPSANQAVAGSGMKMASFDSESKRISGLFFREQG